MATATFDTFLLQGDALTKMFAFNRRVVQLSSSHKKPTPEVVKALAAELVALGAPIKEVSFYTMDA